MSGWHVRLWRRMRIAPGVTVNLSKSGTSLSLGPRGSKVTFGHGRVRQTMGIPGTGLFMSRQDTLSHPQPIARVRIVEPPEVVASDVPSAEAPPAASAVLAPREASQPAVPDGWQAVESSPTSQLPAAAPTDAVAAAAPPKELHFGWPLVVAIVVTWVLAVQPASSGLAPWAAPVAGVVSFLVGLAYEWLAHHHPLIAKAIAQVIVGALVLGAALVAIGLAMVGVAAVVGVGSSRRH